MWVESIVCNISVVFLRHRVRVLFYIGCILLFIYSFIFSYYCVCDLYRKEIFNL